GGSMHQKHPPAKVAAASFPPVLSPAGGADCATAAAVEKRATARMPASSGKAFAMNVRIALSPLVPAARWGPQDFFSTLFLSSGAFEGVGTNFMAAPFMQ